MSRLNLQDTKGLKMSLNRRNKYGSDWGQPTAESPQGPFTNRSAPDSEDGSWMEKDWANDAFDGMQGALLTAAGYTPNGDIDTAVASQVFDALVNKKWTQFANYEAGTIVKGSDGKQYYCNKPTGRDSSAVDPVGDGTDSWREYPYAEIVSGSTTAKKYWNGDLIQEGYVNATSAAGVIVNLVVPFIGTTYRIQATSNDTDAVFSTWKDPTSTTIFIQKWQSYTGVGVPGSSSWHASGKWV